jgi:hypothetical protein
VAGPLAPTKALPDQEVCAPLVATESGARAEIDAPHARRQCHAHLRPTMDTLDGRQLEKEALVKSHGPRTTILKDARAGSLRTD